MPDFANHLSAKTAFVNKTIRDRDLAPQELARECLAEARNDIDRAIALAGRRARGAKLRATHVAIGDAVRALTENKG